MFKTVQPQGQGMDEVIKSLRSRSRSPALVSQAPIEFAERATSSLSGLETRLGQCGLLKSLLNDFYQFYFSQETDPAPEGGSKAGVTSKKSPMVKARQKTVGGLVLQKEGACPHYLLTFSGNNSETFELYRPLQNFLNELEAASSGASLGARAMSRAMSPRQLSPKLEEHARKIWSAQYQGTDITVELVPEVYLSADLCALVEHRFLPMLKDQASLVETLKQRPLSKWTCCEIKTMLFAIENHSVLDIDSDDTVMTLLAYHYNDKTRSIEHKEPCGCCAQIPKIKESLFGLRNPLLSQACSPTPPASPQRCPPAKVSRTPGRPEKLTGAVKVADQRLKEEVSQRERNKKLISGMNKEYLSKKNRLPELQPSYLKAMFPVSPPNCVKHQLGGGAAPKEAGPKTLFLPVRSDREATTAKVHDDIAEGRTPLRLTFSGDEKC